MKIDKEKFNKLKQLDRIEYRQKARDIRERYDWNISWGFIMSMTIIGLIMVLIGLNIFEISLVNIDGGENLGINLGADIADSLIGLGQLIMKVTFLFLLMEMISGIFFTIKEYKKIKELEQEYFITEVKK